MEWIEVQEAPPTLDEPIYLSLVRETQLGDAPDHWLLFVGRDGQTGKAYQVTGDAEFMSYVEDIRRVELSDDFKDSYQLATITQEQAEEVREVAKSEVPPKAKDRASVVENCQGWAVRVVERLVGMGIVGREKLGMMRGLVQPLGST